MRRPKPLNFVDFQKSVSRSFVPLQVEAPRPLQFRGALEVVQSGSVGFTLVGGDEHTVHRTENLIEEARPGPYKFMLLLEGSGVLVQGGREVTLAPGALAIYDTDLPYTLDFTTGSRCVVLLLPPARVGLSHSTVRELSATDLRLSNSLGDIVAHHLSTVAENLDSLEGLGGNRLARASVDLVATLLSNEAAHSIQLEDPRNGLFTDIVEYIERNLERQDLSPRTVADAHFISTRLLHSLFQENGSSVASWIRARRLEECHQQLSNPLLHHIPVSSIGARWGFPDPAHFSRSYRSRFGCTPGQTREIAMRHLRPGPG